MKKDWLDDIQERMQGFETEEPAGLWEQIEAQMPKEAKKKRLIPLPVWKNVARVAAVAALVTMAGAVGIRLIQSDTPQPTAFSQENRSSLQNTETAEPIPQPVAQKTELAIATPKRAYIPAVSLAENETGATLQTETTAETAHTEEQEEPVSRTEVRELPESLPTPANDLPTEEPKEKTHWKGSLAMSAYGAGGLGNTTSITHTSDKGMFSAANADVTWADEPLLGIMLFNRGQATERKLRHHIPIRAGINATYWFHPYVGIETGVAYACLLSDSEDGSKDNYIATRQTLHYIGIPLNLKCKIYSWRGLDVYASLGGLAEKCVAGNTKTEYVLAKKTQRTEMEKIEDKPWQFSANLSAGLQYNFAPWAGVYIEPGCSYYFDDRSTLQTIHKERPWNFNLNMGVRFAIGKTRI